jgi:hypothetical protein
MPRKYGQCWVWIFHFSSIAHVSSVSNGRTKRPNANRELYHYKIISLASYSPPPLVNNPPKKLLQVQGPCRAQVNSKEDDDDRRIKRKKKKKKRFSWKTPTQRDFLLSRIRWQPAATLAPSEIPLLDSLSPRGALRSKLSSLYTTLYTLLEL